MDKRSPAHAFAALTTEALHTSVLPRSATRPWVVLKFADGDLLAIYDFSSDGKTSARPVLTPEAARNPFDALPHLPSQGDACRVYIAAMPDRSKCEILDNYLGSLTPLLEQPSIKGFDSLAAQWSRTRRESRHAMDLLATGPEGFLNSSWLDSSQILRGNAIRLTPSIGCYRTESDGLVFVILLHGAVSELSRQTNHWLQTVFDRYVCVFLEEGERFRPCQSTAHSEELRTQLYLLQFYRTALRLCGDFSLRAKSYDQLRSHGGTPQYSTLHPSALADIVADAYYYNMFLDTASATATMTKSLVGIIRATSTEQEKAGAIQFLLAGTDAYSDGVAGPLAQLANRQAHLIALSNVSRNIEDTINSRLLSLLACIFLPLSLATSLLSMSTRFVSLGPLLYDFCGVVILFTSLVVLVFLLLKVYQWLHERAGRMKPNWNLLLGPFPLAHIKLAPWLGILVVWLMVLSSFIVGMVIDINLGFRILGYGIAGSVGVTGVVLLALMAVWCCSGD